MQLANPALTDLAQRLQRERKAQGLTLVLTGWGTDADRDVHGEPLSTTKVPTA